MTDQQYERFEKKIEDLTHGIGVLSTNVQVLTHRIDRVENPEIIDIKNRITENEISIRNNDKKIYAATLAIFVLFTFLQFASANGWLIYQTKTTKEQVKNAH